MSLTETQLAEINNWRAELDANLRKEVGWMTLAGLFWLEEGDNKIGAHPDNNIILPNGIAIDFIGNLKYTQEQVHIKIEAGITVTSEGSAIQEMELKPDASGEPTLLEVNNFVMILIQRGERMAIRLWDKNHPNREKFTGREWYPSSAAFYLEADFSTYDPPKSIPITDIVGDTYDSPVVGVVSFTLDGVDLQLDALDGGEGALYLIFKDLTNGKETYQAGRYMYTKKPISGKVALDFNQAYNPPCAFTDFATCSLPPSQNYLQVEIKAGELLPASL